jgi:hypothetical protein
VIWKKEMKIAIYGKGYVRDRLAALSMRKASLLLKHIHIRLSTVMAVALALSIPALGQSIDSPERRLGTILGTVTDVNGNMVPGARVDLQGPTQDRRTVRTGENGFFQFDRIEPGIPYQVNITAMGMEKWVSPSVMLEPDHAKILNAQLRIPMAETTVKVTYDPVGAATKQVKSEEQQRVLGLIPNFYVVYDGNPEPLTTKLKFELALKVSKDPVTFAGIAFMAGVKQAADIPNYRQGAEGFGKRLGATGADGLVDIMIGGAILPSLLHQDPRYFYQGTGTTGSRVRHAILGPFIAKGDDGKWQPNYSSVGGDLATSAISNLYYPASNRGAGLVFSSFAIATAERVAASLAQEFLLSKFTRRGASVK